MSITSVVNDLVTSVSVINALKPLPPTISGYSVGGVDDTALDPAGGQTVQINGTGFLAGATITFDGSAVAVVTYVNPNRLTFTSPAKTAGTYTIYAVNPDGGTAIFIPGIIYSVLPTWTTSAGSLGSYYETTSISNTVVASGDAPITYSLFSGSLPTGSTLYANGVITGTAPVDSSSTTYSFTIEAIDAQLQGSTRSFSLTINVDAVTWVSPANNTTYTSAVDSAIANVTLSATDAAGYAVSYSANALPTGLSLSGANISGTPTVIADSSTLLTATAATTNRSAVRTINWSITVAGDPYFEYNTLLIPGASTTFVDDASTNNFAVSIFGDTKPNSFNPYTPGYYSNYFDGSGDYLSVPHNTLLDLWVGNFTIEMWVYSTQNQSNYTGLITKGGSNVGWTGWQVVVVSNCVNVEVPPGSLFFSNATTLPNNQWVHIAIVKSSTNVSLFQNGTRISAVTGSSTTYSNTADNTLFGTDRQASLFLNGYISNTRTVKGTAVYDPTLTTLTVPTSPLTAIANTSLLTCQSNRFIDNSGNAFTITVIGNTSISSFDPFVPNTSYSTYGSGYFDGTGDYLTVPGNSVFAFGTGDFTVEVWLYANSISTGTFDRICATSDYNGSGFDWTLNTNSSGFYLAGTSYNIGSITTKRWHHLVYTRSGSVIRGFLNGNLSSYTTGASQNISSVTQLNIGTGYSGTPLNGYMVDLRIIKGSIPAGYQTSSTTTGTQIFTPPSAPLTAIANTSLLILQNNQSVNNSVFLDNSTNNFLVTRFGNTTQGTFSPYGGNWSNFFNGSTDGYSIANNAAFNLSTGAFTIECWVFPTAMTTYHTVLSNRSAVWEIGLVSNTFYWYVGSTVYSTTISVPTNQWTHVASSSDGTNVKLFVNGVLDRTITGATPGGTSSTLYIANATNSQWFPGYISNLRIVKGTALYTSNFTPSTTPLTVVSGTSLLTCADNRIVDDSINNFTITKIGNNSIQRFSPFNPSLVTPTSYSGYFDGTGDYLSAPSNSAFAFGTGNFTLECWIYVSSPSDTPIYEGRVDGNSTLGFTLTAFSSTVIRIFCGSILISATVANYTNQWTHVAVVKNSGTTTLYVNGVSGGTTASLGNLTDTQPLIGAGRYTSSSSPSAYMNGYVSNFRIVKGTAVYTGAFTPSTTPLTAIANTSLLTCQSTTFIDNSTNNFTITAFGNSQPSIQNPFGYTSTTTQGYTSSTIGGSGYFDGTGDYLTFPNNAVFAFGTGSYTIEFWVNGPLASDKFFLSGRAAIGTMHITTGGTGSPAGTLRYVGTSTIASSNVVMDNTWHHCAIVRNGSSNITLYVDGVSVGTGTDTTNYTNTTGTWYIASNDVSVPSNIPTAYISDLRIVRGTALYTSNFVPPSAPLTAVQNTVLLTNMTSAGVYDAAMMNNMETVGDAKLSTAISKFGGSSMSFDGTGDYLDLPLSLNFSQQGSWTVEMWIYPTTANNCYLYSQVTSNFLQLNLAGNMILYVDRSGVGNLITAGAAISLNTWTHVALVSEGTTVKLYINGTQSGSTASYSTVTASATTTRIGAYQNSGSAGTLLYYGYIDDLRITRGYARYTSNFTPPTTAFPVY